MQRLTIGLGCAVFFLGLAACDNGPGGKTVGGMDGSATGGAGGTPASASVSGGATGPRDTATGGRTATGGAGGTSASAAGGAPDTGGTTAAPDAAAGAIETGGMTGAAGAGGTGGASMTGGSQPDAGMDGGTIAPDANRDVPTVKDTPSDINLRPDAAADNAPDAIASNCLCLGKPAPVCMPIGNITYTLARAPSPTADQNDAYKVITCAMDMAVAYYNCNAAITGSVRVSYDTGVATADGNINGSIRFGSSRSYMQCATAMHEIGHTQGVGTAPQWAAHVVGGVFVGTNATAQLKTINATLSKPLDTVLHADGMHFWPYGLNYETEATGTDILVGHCQIVTAMRKDLGL